MILSFFVAILGQIIDLKKKKQRAINRALWNPTINLFLVEISEIIMRNCVVNKYSLKSLKSSTEIRSSLEFCNSEHLKTPTPILDDA
jgi:hypothetical protein